MSAERAEDLRPVVLLFGDMSKFGGEVVKDVVTLSNGAEAGLSPGPCPSPSPSPYPYP